MTTTPNVTTPLLGSLAGPAPSQAAGSPIIRIKQPEPERQSKSVLGILSVLLIGTNNTRGLFELR